MHSAAATRGYLSWQTARATSRSYRRSAGTQAGDRFVALQQVARAGNTQEQIMALAQYHGNVMDNRGQQAWLYRRRCQDQGACPHGSAAASGPQAAGFWFNNYYLPQFTSLVKGLQEWAHETPLPNYRSRSDDGRPATRLVHQLQHRHRIRGAARAACHPGREHPRNRLEYEQLQQELTTRRSIFGLLRPAVPGRPIASSAPAYRFTASGPNAWNGGWDASPGTACSHPKVITWRIWGRRVIGAGSANLTVSGWGNNLEASRFSR